MDMTVVRAFAAAAILAVATVTLYSYGQQLVGSRGHAEPDSDRFAMFSECSGPNLLQDTMGLVEGLSLFWVALAMVAGLTVCLSGMRPQPARRSILGLEERAARQMVEPYGRSASPGEADNLTPLERVIRGC